MPFQITSKKRREIDFDEREQERIKKILGVIGGFHSHIGWRGEHERTSLSREDIEGIREDYHSGIEVVVVLNTTKRATGLRVNECEIRGCFRDNGDVYRMIFGAYYLDGERLRRTRLFIPRKALRQYF